MVILDKLVTKKLSAIWYHQGKRWHNGQGTPKAMAQCRKLLLVSQPAKSCENFVLTERQKVCKVELQICLPSCISESSNIQLGHIRQTGYKETVCYMISPLVFYFYRKEQHQWHHQIDNVIMETMLPKQRVTERWRQSLLVSRPATFCEKFNVTERQKVCTVKIQICVPSCRSESSNIQLGHIRQTG